MKFKAPSDVIRMLFLASLYLVAAHLGLLAGPVNGYASLVWAPSGIALGALLILGPSWWPFIFFGAFAANFIHGAPFFAAIGIAIGNALSALIGYSLIKRASFHEGYFGRFTLTLSFLAFGPLLSTLVSATIGVSVLYFTGAVDTRLADTWLAWWLGDMLGDVVVAPAILAFWFNYRKPLLKNPAIQSHSFGVLEWTLLAVSSALIAFLVLEDSVLPFLNTGQKLYFMFPVLIWACLRFDLRGVTIHLLMVASVAIGHVFFHARPGDEALLHHVMTKVQPLLALYSGMALILYALIEESLCTFREKIRWSSDQAFLANAGTTLAHSLDSNKTLRALAGLVVPRLADWCQISLYGEDGALEEQAAIHADPSKIILAERLGESFPPRIEEAPYSDALRTGHFLHILPQDSLHLSRHIQSKEYRELLTELGLWQILIVPFKCVRGPHGVMTLVMSSSTREFSQSDVFLAEELSRIASYAIDNAFLYAKVQNAVRSRDRFLSFASHELKTPLTSLLLQIQLLLSQSVNKEVLDAKLFSKMLAICESQVNRLSALIDRLLDLTRIQNGHLKLNLARTDLSKLTLDVVSKLNPQAVHAGSKLTVADLHSVSGLWDSNQIEHVVSNLLSNAIKYGGGKPIEVGINEDTDFAILTVKDHGVGIAPGDLTEVFKRFKRASTDNKIEGLGLGLYIVKQIVSAHNGEVELESKLGMGSTFRVKLPLRQRQVEPRQKFSTENGGALVI